jgi:hypothetical protein
LGHAIEINQLLLHQGGHTVGEQLIQEVEVRDLGEYCRKRGVYPEEIKA